MKNRCSNYRGRDFHNYGGRGITVCDAWLHDFTQFLRDLGPRPKGRYSLERRDVNGNYTPENCYWVDHSLQNKNRRNVPIYRTESGFYNLRELALSHGFKYQTLHKRVASGMTVEEALSTPLRSWPGPVKPHSPVPGAIMSVQRPSDC
jgi:hypothetical protein